MSSQHPLERRSSLLATRMLALRDALRDAVAAEGDRQPFTEHKTETEAFAWWRAHRNDEHGKKVVERMPPARVMELDLWLSQKIAAERYGEQEVSDAGP